MSIQFHISSNFIFIDLTLSQSYTARTWYTHAHTPHTRPIQAWHRSLIHCTHAAHTPHTRRTHTVHTPYARRTHAAHTPYTLHTHAHTPHVHTRHTQHPQPCLSPTSVVFRYILSGYCTIASTPSIAPTVLASVGLFSYYPAELL